MLKRSLAVLMMVLIVGVGLSLTASANTEETITVTVNPNAVVAMDIAGNNLSYQVNIDQWDLESGSRYYYIGNFTLRTWAISDWKVKTLGNHETCTGGASADSLSETTDFTCGNTDADAGALEVTNQNGNWIAVNSTNKVAWGSNNMANPYSNSHRLRLDLSKLNDQTADDSQTADPDDSTTTRENPEQWKVMFRIYDSTNNLLPSGC